jgi:flavin reductase (DIM6/NTAB) family NADH-FMN oxidoreductase RutF
MSQLGPEEARRALALLPGGVYLMTACFQTRRAGVVVRSVQPCAEEPPLLCVSLRKGHSIEPLIRDSRCFAICAVDREDRVLIRKFGSARPPDTQGDPFDWLEVEQLATGSPVLKGSSPVLDCEVYRHFDVEADHELYVGLVLGARSDPRAPEPRPRGAAT